MIDTEKLLSYIVKSKRKVVDIAEQLGLSEIAFIKCVGNISDFTLEQLDLLCDILRIPQNTIKEQ